MYCCVLDSNLEVEGVRGRDIGPGEDRTGAVAGRELHGGNIDEADIGAGNADQGVLHAEEARVIAPVADEVLVLDAHIGVGEGAALWLEDGADMLVWHDHVETREQVVVRQRSDTLGRGETSAEAGVE